MIKMHEWGCDCGEESGYGDYSENPICCQECGRRWVTVTTDPSKLPERMCQDFRKMEAFVARRIAHFGESSFFGKPKLVLMEGIFYLYSSGPYEEDWEQLPDSFFTISSNDWIAAGERYKALVKEDIYYYRRLVELKNILDETLGSKNWQAYEFALDEQKIYHDLSRKTRSEMLEIKNRFFKEGQ